jgi:hypothetical protein
VRLCKTRSNIIMGKKGGASSSTGGKGAGKSDSKGGGKGAGDKGGKSDDMKVSLSRDRWFLEWWSIDCVCRAINIVIATNTCDSLVVVCFE